MKKERKRRVKNEMIDLEVALDPLGEKENGIKVPVMMIVVAKRVIGMLKEGGIEIRGVEAGVWKEKEVDIGGMQAIEAEVEAEKERETHVKEIMAREGDERAPGILGSVETSLFKAIECGCYCISVVHSNFSKQPVCSLILFFSSL